MQQLKLNNSKFKQTELGELPVDWEIKTLENEFIEFKNGLWKGKKEPFINVKVLRNTNFSNDGTLNFNDVAELNVEKKQFKTREIIKEDIILERSGGGPTQPVGRVVFFDKEDEYKYSFSNFTTRIRVINKEKIYPKYLLYFLLEFYLSGKTNNMQNRTTGIRNLDFSRYKKIKIPLPPLPEQKKIAYVLSTIQEDKEKTENVINALKELKKSLMKHLFKYGPVRFDETDKVKLKKTEIGEIPEGWEVEEIKDLIEKTKQKDMRKENIEFKYIDVSSIDRDFYKIVGFTLHKGKTSPSRARKIVKTNDVIVATVRPTLKRIALVSEEYDNQICSTAFCVLRANKDKLNPKYLYYSTQRPLFFNALESIQRGASYPAVTDSDIKKQKIVYPPLPTQQQIAEILSTVDSKIEQEENKKKALEELFKSMLHNLMSGKIRVKDIEVQDA